MLVFAAAALVVIGGTFLLRRTASNIKTALPVQQDAKKAPSIPMDDERIRLAQIDLREVGPAKIAKRLVVPGTVVPDAGRVARVSVKLSGTVADLRKNIGDDVVKGEVLAVLESSQMADAKSEYLSARLTNELQQDLTSRDKLLWEGRAAPEQQYIKSRSAAAQTVMRLSIARQKLLALGVSDGDIAGIPSAPDGTLRSQDIVAPISGRIAERKVEKGAAVGRDSLETELFNIVDLGKVWVDLSVSSSDLPSIHEGQAVRIASRALPESGTAKIIFVSPLLDKDTRNARVAAELDNSSGRWRPGSFVTASIALEERNAAIVAPITALQTIDGNKCVFVRSADGFEKRDVVLGQRDGDLIEVVSGLSTGETIAVSNTFSLKAEIAKPKGDD